MVPAKNTLLPKYKRRVGLAFQQGLSFVEKVRHGIVEYAQSHGKWNFVIMPEMLTPSVEWLRHAKLDGALALVVTRKDAKQVRAFDFPLVNLAGHLKPLSIPSVMVDHYRIGEMAAAFLLQRNFRRVAYYGTSDMWYSQQRFEGFSAVAKRAGAQCRVFMSDTLGASNQRWRDQHRVLLRWLRELKPPVGILASIDLRAAMVVDACLEAGLRVPDDVAVMGVDNDPAVCELGAVPITSVARNDWKVGWEAAALLDRLMNGEATSGAPILVAPERVVQRASTEAFAVDDAFVAGLLAEMRARIEKPFGVEWLMEKTGRSRRWLELHFRKTVGKSPYAVITQLRVAKAQELLAGKTHMPLTDIAAQCGFSDPRRFRIVFRQATGVLPKAFRNEQRGNPAVETRRCARKASAAQRSPHS
jgi:LacI family transcriptional regulator